MSKMIKVSALSQWRLWPELLLRRISRLSLILLFLCSALFPYAPLFAQGDTPAQSTPAAVDVSQVSPDQVNEIARSLWCPLCSGVRLDACELKACQQMKQMIAVKLAEGQDLDAIRTYFVAQYGPQVLGEPPREGFNWLAWILPFAVLLIGAYVLWNTLRRMVRPAPVPVTTSPLTATETSEDPYERKLAEELKRYG